MHVRASVKRRSRETRETRVSRLQSRAWSFACLRRFARRTKKTERLVVVYLLICHNAFNAKFLQSYRMSHPKIWVKLPPKNAKRPRVSLKISLLNALLFLLFDHSRFPRYLRGAKFKTNKVRLSTPRTKAHAGCFV